MSTAISASSARRRDHRVLIAGLFAVYLALLTWVVLWKLGVPSLHVGDTRAVKLVPFVAGDGYGVNTPFEMTANLGLFVPFGVYLALLAPTWRWWRIAGLAAVLSVGFETTQYVLAVGSSDVTDVILNTAGAVTGVALLTLVRRALGGWTATVLVAVCAGGTVLALAAAAAFVAGPVRYGPPPGELSHVRPLQR
ncbi:VanZ family protein [Leifsonia sp. ku-ls]|nr:VanZ family protein [Leifsonia sp. ku-ls]